MNSDALVQQFRQEAPRSPYITEDFLRYHCKKAKRYYLTPKAPLPDKELLWERDGWKIQRIRKVNQIRIKDPEGSRRALGGRKLLLAPILYHIHAQEKIAELRAQGRLEYGIVFCGGGAKGAFQLGVWKRLAELGTADRFTGISGASVGALNALLFALGDYQTAEDVWLSLQTGDLLRPNEHLISGITKVLGGNIPALLFQLLTDWKKDAALLSKEKLEEIVRDNLSTNALRDKLAFVSLTGLTYLRVKRLGGKSAVMQPEYNYLDPRIADARERTFRKVMASAAMPVAFSPEGVDGKICIDGGVLDNAPAYPLIRAGYKKILVVHLDPRHEPGKDREERFRQKLEKIIHGELKNAGVPDTSIAQQAREMLGNVMIRHVWPAEDLGGTLIISPEKTRERICAGYQAAGWLAEDSAFWK